MDDLESNSHGRLPLSLKIVAVIFILGGISSAIEIFISLTRNHININFGILGIFIGIGLFRLRLGWRTCALVFTWIGLIAVPLVGFFFMIHPGPLDFIIFGQKVGHASKGLGLAMIVITFAYTLWQYRVLTRDDVRKLFMNQVGEQDGTPDT